MFVSSGSFLIWVGNFASWSFDTISLDDAISQVSAYLKNNYNLLVTDYNDTLDSSLGSGTVTLTLQTNMDRGDINTDDGVSDIKSNVDDAWARVNTYGATPPNLTGSSCNVNSIVPTSGGSGPAYSFSFRNLLPTWLGGAPVTPEQQAQYAAQGKAQIQAVASNAALAQGARSPGAVAAKTAADTQSTAFSRDATVLAAAQNADAAAHDNAQRNILIFGVVVVSVVVLAVVLRPYAAAASA